MRARQAWRLWPKGWSRQEGDRSWRRGLVVRGGRGVDSRQARSTRGRNRQRHGHSSMRLPVKYRSAVAKGSCAGVEDNVLDFQAEELGRGVRGEAPSRPGRRGLQPDLVPSHPPQRRLRPPQAPRPAGPGGPFAMFSPTSLAYLQAPSRAQGQSRSSVSGALVAQ